ncbi:MAG: isochorismatase [Hyphobacterium sp.]|nr:MAG: isochorismatase [Hyphobacterium sp.]
MLTVLPVDIQIGLDDGSYWGGNRNNLHFEANVARLLKATRQANRALIHIKHNSDNPESPLRPDQPGNDFKPESMPLEGETVIGKSVNSAFIGTDLESRLRKAGSNRLIIFGLTTQHCVSTTVRMAGNLGFDTCLVGDATAAFPIIDADGNTIDAETVHRIHLASLDGEFARVISTDEAVSLITATD